MSSEDQGLDLFLTNFQQDIFLSASGIDDEDEQGCFTENAFTQLVIDYLIEAGEIEDGHVCYHKARGLKINGYNLQEDEGRLDLFVSLYTQARIPETVPKEDINKALNQALSFLQKIYDSYHKKMEESSEAFDMAQLIYSKRNKVNHIRLFLFTDALTTSKTIAKIQSWEQYFDTSCTLNVWDLRRIYRCVTSGQKREAIEINFQDQYGLAISCLAMPESYADYSSYIAIIPGEIIWKIYAEYGSRLLERNVRSFLQATGKVNKGIRDTILKEPHRFFAYNNGISATAESVQLVDLPNGGKGIAAIRDLQIVNGGQTTASLYHAVRKNKADVSKIYVQAKLTIVPSEHINEIVPLISRYANNQNKVNEADFSANSPFHIRIEELSRTIWAPASHGAQHQTRWFYERARGQYADAKNRESTPAKQKNFKLLHPSSQKFTKTDLAKFENTWHQFPHIVSLGAQKNFVKFTLITEEEKWAEPDEKYFHRLIAKAILFKSTEKIIQNEKFGGYRANIVTYTLSYMNYMNQPNIDLDLIWKQQKISNLLEQVIRKVSHQIHAIITDPPGGRNITEWCKKEECWERIKLIPREIFNNN